MQPVVATYVHHFSPFLWKIRGDFGIRWYGFMYVVGLILAFFLMRWFIRLRCCALQEEKAADFITLVALFGVMLGGRLGYMLFYNREEFFTNPLIFFNFLQGGMASHGAIFGICLVVFFYARRQGISWPGLGDNIVICGPLGVFFGRIGNFINGELYGRVTTVPWAVMFPSELHKKGPQELAAFVEKASSVAPELAIDVRNMANLYPQLPHYEVAEMMIEASRKNDAFRALLGESGLLSPRHPSQLYQAFCEGLLVFAILLAVRLIFRRAWHGFISGLFFILYAIARILVENLREPDSERIMGLTKGQFYSVWMLVIGIGFIAWAFRTRRTDG